MVIKSKNLFHERVQIKKILSLDEWRLYVLTNNKILPDQHHIEQIRKRLWMEREYGKVSVMVGSGFSLNAEKVSERAQPFLNWTELISILKKDLYPYQELDSTSSTSDALKIASEYELTFGRQALDDLIIRALPDQDHIPGKLHKLLLSLPWGDVFTTNYDTLLERTRPYIYDRKYDLVLTVSDIPNKMKPRIVKLHGSFPSHRPFIITEEDYRSYPKDYSAFVNTVQQSIMENILCLVGFSGDDPNFLKWIGWVRDNLGKDTPPIYFCGFISTTQKRVLEARGITPIDFSPLFPDSEYPGAMKFQKALEWFLVNLKYGKKPDVMKWPVPNGKKVINEDIDLPYIPEGPSPFPELGELRPEFNQTLEKEDLLKLIYKWKNIRLNYPGWIIAPKDSRDKIWRYTEGWINPILTSIEKLSLHNRLALLYELNWRLEVALKPLFTNWVDGITTVVEKINPFPKCIAKSEDCINPNDNLLDWSSIRDCWVELNFALARNAREDQDIKRFTLCMEKLEKVINNRLDWVARWHYEMCLFNIFKLDIINLKNILDRWPKTPELPFWEVKRAALLAEIGEMEESEKTAQNALDQIRLRLKADRPDYSLLSQEGWVMVLIKALKDNQWDRDNIGEYSDRWAELGRYRCNPWHEIETLMGIIASSTPGLSGEKKGKKSFDPGQIVKQFNLGSSISDEMWHSFSILRMLEEAAIPFRCGMVAFFTKEIVKSAKWVEPYAPLWAFSSIIRTGKGEELEERFDRVTIVTLTDEEVNHFYNLLLSAFEQIIKDTEDIKNIHSFMNRILPSLIELISRICFRFSDEQLNNLFDLAMTLYANPFLRKKINIHRYVCKLFRRILFAFPDRQIVEKMESLLVFPIPEIDNYNVGIESEFVEPFDYINWSEDYKLSDSFNRDSWDVPISKLLNVAASGTDNVRRRAITRLNVLNDIDAFTKYEKEEYEKALWAKIDDETGLPMNLNIYEFGFLSILGAETRDIKGQIKKLILETEIPSIYGKSFIKDQNAISYSGGHQFDKYINNCRGASVSTYFSNENEHLIEWTTEEAEKLLKKVITWWSIEKDILLSYRTPVDPKEHVRNIILLLGDVILPNLDRNNDKVKDNVCFVLNELEQAGYCILSALPVTLYLELYSTEVIIEKLRRGLNSINEIQVSSSLKGVLLWVFNAVKSDNFPDVPKELIDEWIYKIYSRRLPMLDEAINNITSIIGYFPHVLDRNYIMMLNEALRFLKDETDLVRLKNKGNQEVLSYFPDDLMVEYRALSARLAFSLYQLLKTKEIPSIIMEWKEVCMNDPLPEVRKAWKNK